MMRVFLLAVKYEGDPITKMIQGMLAHPLFVYKRLTSVSEKLQITSILLHI